LTSSSAIRLLDDDTIRLLKVSRRSVVSNFKTNMKRARQLKINIALGEEACFVARTEGREKGSKK
jgi:hypothetical protein